MDYQDDVALDTLDLPSVGPFDTWMAPSRCSWKRMEEGRD